MINSQYNEPSAPAVSPGLLTIRVDGHLKNYSFKISVKLKDHLVSYGVRYTHTRGSTSYPPLKFIDQQDTSYFQEHCFLLMPDAVCATSSCIFYSKYFLKGEGDSHGNGASLYLPLNAQAKQKTRFSTSYLQTEHFR